MRNNIIVDKNKLNNYKLKITTLSPIHIGTGDVYEPTNFVIDNNTLYEFDEVLFYKSLNSKDKQKLNTKLDNWMEIIAFYKERKEEAKAISYFECKSSDEVQKKYNTRINRDGSRNKNQLEINKTFKNPNTHRAIIPGSSIKGMLDTILQIYPKRGDDNNQRQNLILSDALLLDGATQIGYMKRADRDRSQVINKNGGISQIVEVVEKNSSFVASVNTNLTFDDIKLKMKKYHAQRTNSKYKDTDTSFISRVGKYSGMEYFVDNISDAVQPGRERKPLGTHSLYLSDGNMEQFGWIKIELISDDEYENSLKDISNQEKEYYKTIEEKQKSIKDSIQKAKDEAIALKLKKEADEKAEKEADEKAKIEREKELASMDPIDKIIDSFGKDVTKVINAMKDGSIENIDDIKVELAVKLKAIMQKDPKQWEKAKQKALKRKEYIESLL